MEQILDRQERDDWNRRYAEGEHMAFEPDPFLLSAYQEYICPLFPQGGAALDVAGGLGRHAIWLAELRWKLTVVDISQVAFGKAQRKAEERGVNIDFLVHDLTTWSPNRKAYDLILVFFYLQRDLFPALEASLKPGGLLLYKTYTEEQKNYSSGPSRDEYLLRENELLRSFPTLRTLYYRETIQEKGVAELVAIRR
ncbi:MAG: class I SAM-dependent methyltransferase [Candidatus Korobacteraceae bacterium]